ncbi:hypothetical protein TrRE_jg1201, partial [Triparma retinervis]
SASAITSALSAQTSQLTNARDMGDNQTYLLAKSDRILRGMGSWGGWAYNMLSSGAKETKAPKG